MGMQLLLPTVMHVACMGYELLCMYIIQHNTSQPSYKKVENCDSAEKKYIVLHVVIKLFNVSVPCHGLY